MTDNSKLNEIYDAIPHRPPFLFVDEIVEISENKIVTLKKMEPCFDFFKGHYPKNPIVPGVILCEAAFQSGAVLISKTREISKNAVPVVTRAGEIKFRKMVKPGDTIEITVEIIEKVSSAYFMKASVSSNGKNVMRCEFAVSEVESGGEAK